MGRCGGTSDQRHQPALSVGVAVDVPLGRLNGSVAGEDLHVPERPTGFMNEAGSPGDECPAARVGRAPRQPQVSIRTGEPVGDARWGQAAAAFGTHNVQRSVADLAPPGQRFPQIIIKLDPAATPVFAAPSCNSIYVAISPLGSRTIGHVRFAISPARRPALTDSRTITRLRPGYREAWA